jgi:DNA-binding NarL/FixJ family response regulator
MSIRVLIVDDHEMVRAGLRTLLGRFPSIEIVGDAGSVESALKEAAKLKPDVVLLDIRLGSESGFDVCSGLSKLDPAPRVLVLTSFADDDVIFQAIRAGVDGYVLKDIDSEALVKGIETVAAGQSMLDPKVTARVLGRVRNPSSAEPLNSLSPQEKRVLALVAQGKTNKEIGIALGLSDKTVKNYFANVLDKLNVGRRSQAAAIFAGSAR